YRPNRANSQSYTVVAEQTQASVLGIPGVSTTVWAYGSRADGRHQAPAFPGRTFVTRRHQPISVNWRNHLVDRQGAPLSHLLPVDQSLALSNLATGVPLAVHHHGGDTAAEFDGGPDQWQTPKRVEYGPGVILGDGSGANAPGRDGVTYSYGNDEEASLKWYHDHAEGMTRLNTYAGLAGLYVVRDANEAALIKRGELPAGEQELALILQDRIFTADGSLAFAADPGQYPVPIDPNPLTLPADQPTHVPEMFGDIIMVNGLAWPDCEVEARQYRVRMLNASDARFYTLDFGSAAVWQIGTDLGFLNRPLRMSSITIAPGERLDLVIDFSGLAGQKIVVGNSAATPFPFGDLPVPGSGSDVVMRFSVRKAQRAEGERGESRRVDIGRVRTLRGLAADTPRLPATPALPQDVTVRRVLLGEGCDEYGRVTPMLGSYDPSGEHNPGTLNFHDPATETPRVGSTEIWEFWNTTEDAHPVHMHLVRFRILDRQEFTGNLNATVMGSGWTGVQLTDGEKFGPQLPAPDHEQGWKDTVICPPGHVTRVLVSFNRPGKYVYHCHILSHEEHDMMRWFVVS
ncbi:MAG: hypothetical protein RJA44_2314, partial [Pseudomonadota bacterium]